MILGKTEPRIFTPPKRDLIPCACPPGTCYTLQDHEIDGETIEGHRFGCGVGRTTDGYACIRFAEQLMGLTLFPWQEWLLLHALELNEDGSYRFRYVIVLVARQNGKSLLLLVLALWHLFALGSPEVIATAQDLGRSEAAWKEAVEWVEEDEELSELIVNIDRGHPKLMEVGGDNDEEMGWKRVYRVASAGRRGGRGFSGDLVLMDELREHQTWDTWGTVTNDLADTTPILKADGEWTTIGRLVPGDTIFSPDGKPTKVLNAYPIDEPRPMYRVTSSDGRSVIASESHLWSVRDQRKTYDKTRWEVISTGEMLERGLVRQGTQWAFRLPMQEALSDIPGRNLPIDPYILGAWLGDGSSHHPSITVGGDDLDATVAQLEAAGARIHSRRVDHRFSQSGVWTLWLHDENGSLRSRLVDMNLLGNKHVPAEYETASADQRLALLQGLLDTDGCVTRARTAQFTSVHEHLADSVCFLVRSLGWTAWKSKHKSNGGGCVDEGDYAPYWLVHFSAPGDGPIPFRLPRKADRFGSPNPRMRPRLHTSVVSIEPVPTESSTCIEVDSGDHLFLAGRDLIPTHNTMNARPSGQAWAFSNAGDNLSIVLRYLRAQAHKRLGWPDGDADKEVLGEEDPELAAFLEKYDAADKTGFFEWSSPPKSSRTDIEALAQANPSMNHFDVTRECITHGALLAGLGTTPPGVYDTEVRCIWVPMLGSGPFPEGSWEATLDDTQKPADTSAQVVCVSVSKYRSKSYIARAGWTEDGKPVVGIAEERAGTDWIIPWLVKNRATYEHVVAQDKGAPVSSLWHELESARDTEGSRLPLVPWTATDVAPATGIMFDRLLRRDVYHLSHPGLDDAALSALPKILSRSAFEIDPVKSPTDVQPLQAAIGALWALEAVPPDVEPQLYDWPDEEEISRWLKEAESEDWSL